MKKLCFVLTLFVLFVGAWGLAASPGHVNLVTIDGAIGPVSARIISDAIKT
jgi:membrane-bound ClpP family serine protease